MKKVILSFLLLIILLISCSKKEELKEYEIMTVKKGDISLSTQKTGQVVSDDVISVYTTASQRVQKVFFKAGDNVKKGDVVVTFYPVDKNDTLRKIQIKSLEVQQKQRDLRNASELFKVGGVSKVSVDDARIALQTTQLELATLQEDLSLIKNEITSPVDGVITEMTADENYKVNTETTLFKVSDTKNMKVQVSLSDSQIKNVAVGQRVEITSDSLPEGEKIEGVVSEISGSATKSGTLDESNTTVNIKLNDTKNLRPGSTINAVIFYKESKNVLKVPYTSVMNQDGKFYIFTVNKENKVMKKEVKLSKGDDDYYEVISGISDGENIIVAADESLQDGEKIKTVLSSGEGYPKNDRNSENSEGGRGEPPQR